MLEVDARSGKAKQPLVGAGFETLSTRAESHELFSDKEWWRTAVTLQIYPRSFQDSDGDGNGDIRGITERMDEIAALGIDAIWLNPIHASPGVDGNYDLSSYEEFNPMFGDESAVIAMVDAAHTKGIRVIFDIVMNHTSNEHPWYKLMQTPEMHQRRIASNYDYRIDPEANMYIFRPVDPEHPDTPPNNWQTFFADAPAWAKDPRTGEWVFSKFTPGAQPDLNLYNPLVRKYMVDVAQMWIERYGIDGIRMDVIDHTFEDPLLRNFDPNPHPKGNGHMDRWNWRRSWLLEDEPYRFAAEVANAMREAAERMGRKVVSIGEVAYDEDQADQSHLDRFYTEGDLDIPFNFALQAAVAGHGANAAEFKRVWDRYVRSLPEGACPNIVLSNHDQVERLADKVGPENMKAITMMLLALGNRDGSNAFMYMGDELGMVKGDVITAENMRDPQGRNLGPDHSRDNVRTGYAWGGRRRFSDGTPWLPIGLTADRTSYEEQNLDPNSMLNFTRGMIAARKGRLSALRFGEYIPYDSGDNTVFSFGRSIEGQNLMVNLNFSDAEKVIILPSGVQAQIMHSTDNQRILGQAEGRITLSPHEGCILQLIY